MGSAYLKAPIRRGQVFFRKSAQVVDEDLPGSFGLTRVSYPCPVF